MRNGHCNLLPRSPLWRHELPALGGGPPHRGQSRPSTGNTERPELCQTLLIQ